MLIPIGLNISQSSLGKLLYLQRSFQQQHANTSLRAVSVRNNIRRCCFSNMRIRGTKKTLKILKNVLKTPLKKCIRFIRCGRRNSLTIQHIYYIGCCSEVIFLHYALFLGTVPELGWKSFSLPVYFMIALKRIII